MQPRTLAKKIKELSEDKKAEDLVILDLTAQSGPANYFVICHGNNDRHVRTIAEFVVKELKDEGQPAWHVEGLETGKWVLVDYSSVILHVFYKEVRGFYGLERLWGDAKEVVA